MVVDDHPCVVRGIQACLMDEGSIAVVGQASNGIDAVEEAQRLTPDVILMDLTLPSLDGVGAMKRIRARLPVIRFIDYTMHENSEMVQEAIRGGASGYVLKVSPLSVLVSAIEAVNNGGRYFDPALPSQCSQFVLSSTSHDLQPAPALTQPEDFSKNYSGKETSLSVEAVADCENYIHENLSASLTVKGISSVLGKHPSDLDRMFWRNTGETIKAHVDRLCKEKVERKLKNGECKGSQIALELGFRDDQAFYRWIQRVFRMPFRELREIHATNPNPNPNPNPNQTKPNESSASR